MTQRIAKRSERRLTPEEKARVAEVRRLVEGEREDILRRGREILAEERGQNAALRDVSRLLKTERLSQGLTLAEVQQRSGIDPPALPGWRTKRTRTRPWRRSPAMPTPSASNSSSPSSTRMPESYRDAAALEAIVFVENQLEHVTTRTGARVGDQTPRKIAAARREGQYDFQHGPIRIQCPLRKRHYRTLQTSWIAS